MKHMLYPNWSSTSGFARGNSAEAASFVAVKKILALTTLFLAPLLSGCCSCGNFTDTCGSNPCGPSYNGCLPAETGRRVNYGGGNGGCSNCQGDETFSLPPEGPVGQPYTSTPAYGQPIYGPETYGPEVVGPEFVPGGDSQWAPQVAPTVPGSPVTPAAPSAGAMPNTLTAPMPIPGISTGANTIPSPSPYSNTSQAGPMMQVPPPPPEPISQMRYRR